MKPLILITNDDGVHSPGIRAAVEAVMDLGDIIVSAPIKQQTGMGRAFLRSEDQGIIEKTEIETGGGKVCAYGVHGTPAYAVVHGVLELAPRKPDLCISGINYGENLGMVLTCSGTVGAALEANSHGIQGIAVSAQMDYSLQRTMDYPEYSWDAAKAVLRRWTKKVLGQGMPDGADLLNINVPIEALDPLDWRITCLARQNYYVFQKPPKRDFSQPFKIQAELQVDEGALKKNSDIYAVYVENKTSVSPLSWDMSV